MEQQRVFLTADWENLLMLSYAVDQSLLQPYVPAGTELDAFDGKTYVSLVGFEFNETRLSGIKVPFHGSFEEVNLRFYVRRGTKRGVVFLRELVPRFAVAAVARIAYGEKYIRLPMSHRIHYRLDRDAVEAEYSWGSGAGLCTMRAETGGASFLAPDGTLSQFITEHYWGYATKRRKGTLEYEVQHAQWRVREAPAAEVSGDATQFFGAEFGRAVMRKPDSAFLVEGSSVTVFKGARID
jgi:uncharacterized protein YqjF (DUF2071 family)